MPSSIANSPAFNRLAQVQARIAEACRRFDRDPATVQLLAVSKGQPVSALQDMAHAGQTRFGESYVQEMLHKLGHFACPGCEWHFIGPLQSNKASLVAENCDWVHSIDRFKIAEYLARARPAGRRPLQVCLQVNISGEASKSGVPVSELAELADRVRDLPGLALRGLMAIPRASEELATQREAFRQVRGAWEDLRALGHELDTLSMGMSGDLEAAIAEGSTLVRIGTALFGPRLAKG